jgi:hypothetical protein
MALTPEEFTLLYWLTIGIIVIKFILVGYLSIKLYQKKKSQTLEVTDFFVGVLIFLLTLAISRTLYFYFDFYLTQFNTANYLLGSNLVYWRIASAISGIGVGFLLIVVDKRVLSFKLKGILGYIVIASAILHLFYPIYTLDDFITLSTIGTISGAFIIIVPIFFLWLGIKSPSNRGIAVLLAVGSILYAIAAFGISEPILGPIGQMFGADIRTFFMIMMTIIRAGSLIVIAVSSTKLQI